MNIRISITQGPALSEEMKQELLKTAQLLWGPKEEEKKMKYFEATAVTPYCGEELTGFYMAESEEKLRESGELDRLIEDCVAEWFDADEYDTYGFACPEDYEEYYYADSGVEVREITKEEYDEAIAKGW